MKSDRAVLAWKEYIVCNAYFSDAHIDDDSPQDPVQEVISTGSTEVQLFVFR